MSAAGSEASEGSDRAREERLPLDVRRGLHEAGGEGSELSHEEEATSREGAS